MPPRKSRQVRGETGALFEVDAEMVDDAPPDFVEGPFRSSAAPPLASAIKPAPAPADWRHAVLLTTFVFVITGTALWIASSF